MIKCNSCQAPTKRRNECSVCRARLCDECTFVNPTNGEYLCRGCMDKDVQEKWNRAYIVAPADGGIGDKR